MPPRDTVRSFAKPESILLFVGIFLVSVYVANRVHSAIYSHASAKWRAGLIRRECEGASEPQPSPTSIVSPSYP